jgi:hypothetical protein
MIKAEQSASELGRRADALAQALEHVTGMTDLKNAELVLPDTLLPATI